MFDKELPFAERIWIFQCNPEKYRIEEALVDEKVKIGFHWKVKQHKNEIKKGDIGIIWRSGKLAGILAITELISDPGEFIESDEEKYYWNDLTNENGFQFRVKMKVIRNLEKPLTKEKIKAITGLQDLSVVKMPRGTNFPVTTEEWEILKKNRKLNNDI